MWADFGAEVEGLVGSVRAPTVQRRGTLARVVGLTLEARGIMAPVGARCVVDGVNGQKIEAEVVGFHDETLYLMPFNDSVGCAPGAAVRVEGNASVVMLGDALLGRVVDGLCRPLDGKSGPAKRLPTLLLSTHFVRHAGQQLSQPDPEPEP